ncbi:uridine kinase [Pelagibacteraceae bacterium]|nr:uridine kinase [Pelagibacteraceae bacterium]
MQLVNECLDKVKKDYIKFLNKEKIYKKSKTIYTRDLRRVYIPIAFWINNKFKKKGKTLFLGLSASQGSGKTTVAGILKIILKTFFKRNVCVISIDDFYKTLNDRNKMAEKKHPLFKTRGVPGTHDIDLIKSFFISIKKKKFKKTTLPKFNKSIDDRLKKKYWYKINQRPEIVLLEGWCVGAKAESASSLNKPVNTLEKYEDQYLVWRKFVNEKLKKEYKKLFSMIDYYIFMKVPNFKIVFEWRMLQEKKLKRKFYYKKKIMTYSGIKRFIMFYQRITLQMVKELSKSASIVMLLKKNHEIKKVLFK